MSRYTPRSSSGSMNMSPRARAQQNDYEEFASLQLDKPTEGELKTTEDMKRHMFDDHFEGRPIDRAIHILAVGEEVQRLSVVRDLYQLIQVDEQGCMQRIIQKIQVALNTASTEFHIETARTFAVILEKRAVSGSAFAHAFLPSVITHVDNRDQVVSNAWLDTLLSAIEFLPPEVIKSHILSVAVNKGQISQTLWQRVAACKMLGKLSSRFDSTVVKKDILPVVLSLCQDVNETVRACICSQLHLVAKGIPPEMIKPALIPILVELGRDETVQVRVEATEAIVKIIPSLSHEVLKVTIIPLIKKICEQAVLTVDDTLVTIARQFGSLCLGLENVLTQSEKLWLITYYHNLSHFGIPTHGPKKDAFFTSQNVDRLNARYIECRQYCAYNFPAMAKFGSSSLELLEKLYPSFCDFATDPYYMVRKTVGAGMHEVARILGSNNRVVKNQVLTLLWDNMEEVLMGIIPHLGRTIDYLISSGVLSHEQEGISLELGRGLLQCDKTIRDKTHNWRLYTDFITQLESVVKCLPSDYIYSHFVSLMFDKMHRARPLPCRLAAARTLLVFLRYNVKSNQRQEIRSRLQSEFCLSSSCYKRMLYLRLCNCAREIFSRAYFKEHFFYPLLSRSEDKVPNNRLILIRQFPSLKAMIIMPSEKKYLQTLETCVRSMAISEKDRDVTTELRSLIHRMDRTETLSDNATTQTAEDIEDRKKYEEELRVASSVTRPGVGYQVVGDNRRVTRESKPMQKTEGARPAQAPAPASPSTTSTVSGAPNAKPSHAPSASPSIASTVSGAPNAKPSHAPSASPSIASTVSGAPNAKPSHAPSASPSISSTVGGAPNASPRGERGANPSIHSISSTVSHSTHTSQSPHGGFQGYTNTTNSMYPLRSLSTQLTNIDQNCTCYSAASFRSENLRNLNLLALIDTTLVNSSQNLSEALRQKLIEDPRINLTKSAKRSMEISWLNLETDLKNELLALSKNRQIHGDRNLKEKSRFLADFRHYNESTLRKFISEDRDREYKETIYNVRGVGGFCEKSSNFFEERINFFERKIRLEEPKTNTSLGDCSCFELTASRGRPLEEINRFSYFSKTFEEDFYRDAGVKANEVIRRKFSGIPVQEKVPVQGSGPRHSIPLSVKRRTWFGNEGPVQETVKLESIIGYKARSCERKKSETLPARESVSLKKLGIGPRSKSFVLPSTLIYSDDRGGDCQSSKVVLEKETKEEEEEEKGKGEGEGRRAGAGEGKRFGVRTRVPSKGEGREKGMPKTKIPVGILGNGSPGGSRSSSPSVSKAEGRGQANGMKRTGTVVSRKSLVMQSSVGRAAEVKNKRRSLDPSKISLGSLEKGGVGTKRGSEKGMNGSGRDRAGGGLEEKGEVEASCNGNLSKLPIRKPKPDK